jgi:hypothetical protein
MMKFVAGLVVLAGLALVTLAFVRREGLGGLPLITERPKRRARSRRSGRRRSTKAGATSTKSTSTTSTST